jgi:hypothetical protein
VPIVEADPEAGISKADLLKQRRLLLGFTFVLAAIHALDVEIGDNVTAQGLVLTFKHPGFLVAALWVAWAWSCWRYWQYERSFGKFTFALDRQRLYDERVRAAVTRGIETAANRGDYADRGLPPGERISVSSPGTGPLTTPPGNEREWFFRDLDVWIGEPQPGMPMKQLKGGANYRLERAEVDAIKRSAETELLLKYPHFADWKAPYFLLWLAPIAGLIDLGRHACIWFHWCTGVMSLWPTCGAFLPCF